MVLDGSLSILGCSLGSSMVFELDLCSLTQLVIPGGSRISFDLTGGSRISLDLTGGRSLSDITGGLGSLGSLSDISISLILSFFDRDPCPRLSSRSH